MNNSLLLCAVFAVLASLARAQGTLGLSLVLRLVGTMIGSCRGRSFQLGGGLAATYAGFAMTRIGRGVHTRIALICTLHTRKTHTHTHIYLSI